MVAEKLFERIPDEGDTFRIGPVPFSVIGMKNIAMPIKLKTINLATC